VSICGITAYGAVPRDGRIGLDYCAVGHVGLDMSEDDFEDGWAGEEYQYVTERLSCPLLMEEAYVVHSA
jgi:hypothetical protein